ncbi:MAG: hypothetical protein M3478_03810 [Planctomycetota bacterium]|nr:hypothetical protein [Planctomycetota bacterium]
MVGRGIIGAAVLAYAVVLGCVLWPSSAPGERASAGDAPSRAGAVGNGRAAKGVLPFRGAAMQLQRVDWTDEYKKGIDEIAALGLDTVSFVVDARQENGTSNRIYLDMRMTPSPEMLGNLIDHAKGKGLRVVLMPIVLLDNPRGDEWRGKIEPDGKGGGWDEWFDSYRQMITHFAWIAEGHKVDVLVVGSELVTTENKHEQWSRTIKDVRKVFNGMLTYSSNWDHYTSVPFWDELDLIAMNSYWKLGDNRKVPVEEIERRWKDIQKDLLPFQRDVNKPLMFLEVGWCSLTNAAHEPWDYTRTEHPVDAELQRKLYEGFFRSWHGNPHFGGFMIWEWTPGEGGKDDKGYTPENKPAEKVLREWIAKPRWEVK